MGHLIVARDVLEAFGFEEVIFVPAYLQPLKGKLLLPPELRLELIKVSIEGETGFSVWNYELERGGVSYTVETLKEFHRKFEEKPAFIMGADSFNSFYQWREPFKILELALIVVVERPGCNLNVSSVFEKLGVKPKWKEFEQGFSPDELRELNVVIFRGRRIEISSTEIRERLKKGKSIRYFVTESAWSLLKDYSEKGEVR